MTNTSSKPEPKPDSKPTTPKGGVVTHEIDGK